MFEWVGVDRDLHPAAANYMAGHVLEIWVPFRCTSNVEGAYDLSCSVEVFVADDETVDPDDPLMWEACALRWGRRRADRQDLMCALSGCALRSSFPDAEL